MPAIWNCFEAPEEKIGNFKVICKHCNASISTAKTVTSNLHKHMKVRAKQKKLYYIIAFFILAWCLV